MSKLRRSLTLFCGFTLGLLAFNTAPAAAQTVQIPSTWICSHVTQEVLRNAPPATVHWDFTLTLTQGGRGTAEGLNTAHHGRYPFIAVGEWTSPSRGVFRFMSEDRQGGADQALIEGTGFKPHPLMKFFGIIVDVQTPDFMNYDKVEGNPQVSARRDATECRRTG